VDVWDARGPGVVQLPSGRLVRGRALGHLVAGPPPQFSLYLLARRPGPLPWQPRWVLWRDFWLPTDRADAEDALREAWRQCTAQRVEIACRGGRSRTGTALGCLAVLDGVPAREAVSYVRDRYDPRAVETPWQRHFIHRFITP